MTTTPQTILQAYKTHLYVVSENEGSEGGNKPLLKHHPVVHGEEEKLRLSELYFHLPYYGVDQSSTDDPPNFGDSAIADFTFMPSSDVATTIRQNLLNNITASPVSESWFVDHDSLDAWFSQILKQACLDAAGLKQDPDSGSSMPHLSLETIKSSFYRRYLLNEQTNEDIADILSTTRASMAETYTNPEALRPYFAWRYIDVMYPGTERVEYFLVERVHLLTKIVFIMAMFHPKGAVPAGTIDGIDGLDFSKVLDVLGRLIVFMVKQSLVYTSIGDPTTEISIDDDAKRNSELSHKIHNNSRTLIKNKDYVQRTQDNLRSLVNADKYVKSTRTRAWYTMVGLVVLLALAVGSMAVSYARGRTGEMNLIAGVIVLGVVAFEAVKGIDKLFTLPVSVFE